MSSEVQAIGSTGGSLREAFGEALVEFAKEDERIVVLDADVAGGTGAHHFRTAYPDRFIQCGIAEQNMMAMAAGMATMGYVPIVTTFGVFASMRALEMLRSAICLNRLNVKVVVSHLGLDVGPDGATHQAIEDIGIVRGIPRLTVLSPCDCRQTKAAVRTMLEYEGPVYLRTGRSPAPEVYNDYLPFKIGRAMIIWGGPDVCIAAVGRTVALAEAAAEALSEKNIDVTLLDIVSLKPLDEKLLAVWAKHCGAVVSVEDHNVANGLGCAVASVLARNAPVPMEMVGIQDRFGQSGEPDELYKEYGLTVEGIVGAVHRVLKRKAAQ